MTKYRSWKAFKADWVAALRSGEYRQGSGFLCQRGRTVDRFCCLGVAVNLLIEAGHDLEWEQQIDVKPKLLSARDSRGAADECGIRDLNIPVWLYSKLSAPADENLCPTHCGSSVEALLAYRNDTGATFGQIADLIDHHL